MKTLAVAANTMREAVRDRILYLLLFFAVLMIAASKVLGMLAVGDPGQIIVDVGIGSIGFFSVVISIFMGIGLVAREIERRTIYSVVSKPLSRESFVLGKFVGMLATIALNQAIMTIALALTLHLWGIPFTPGYAYALALILVESALVLALALLFSALASPMLAAMFTIASYFVGHWLDSLRVLVVRLPPGVLRTSLLVFYRTVPNLEYLNLKNQVVFADPKGGAQLLPQFLYGGAYGCGYTLAALALAALAYRRKDFV